MKSVLAVLFLVVSAFSFAQSDEQSEPQWWIEPALGVEFSSGPGLAAQLRLRYLEEGRVYSFACASSGEVLDGGEVTSYGLTVGKVAQVGAADFTAEVGLAYVETVEREFGVDAPPDQKTSGIGLPLSAGVYFNGKYIGIGTSLNVLLTEDDVVSTVVLSIPFGMLD